MHHIRVDSYGKCLKNKEWPEGKTWEDIVKQYKFVLALEHSNCKGFSSISSSIAFPFYFSTLLMICYQIDYITDKFWKAINFGVVPIVMGAPNIDDYSPSWHSVIKTIDYIGQGHPLSHSLVYSPFTLDFHSFYATDPAQLAEHLHRLNNNDTLYREYIDYKYDAQVSFN